VRIAAWIVLILSLSATVALLSTWHRVSSTPHLVDEDGHLIPDRGIAAMSKILPIWRENLPPDLAACLLPGDEVEVSYVGCDVRIPRLLQDYKSYGPYYTIYEPIRGGVPLGRRTDGLARFVLILAFFPLLAAVAGAALLLSGRRRPPKEVRDDRPGPAPGPGSRPPEDRGSAPQGDISPP
jgi:hypothetical protein